MKTFVEKLATLSGVKDVGFVRPFPGGAQTDFRIEGRPKPVPGNEPYVEIATATPGALEVLGVRLVKGRRFNKSDDANAPLAVIIDDILAEQEWPGENPIGKRLSLDFEEVSEIQHSWWTVIGVIHHMEVYGGVKPALPEAFVSIPQLCTPTGRSAGSWCDPGALLISSDEDRTSLEPMVRDVLYSLDPDLALYDFAPLTEITGSFIAPQRLLVVLLSTLAAIALLLAAAGTYGVMSYMVAGRTSEMAVRRALGATRIDLLRLVLNQGLCISLGGLIVGFVAALVLERLVRPTLLGVAPRDPMILTSVGAFLLIVALAASYVPAHRAMQLNSIEGVRHE